MMKPERVESIPHWLPWMSEPAFVGFVVPFIDGSEFMKVAISVFLFYVDLLVNYIKLLRA